MSSFTLYDLDPTFWARVQAKAKAEGASVKAVILRLLAAWLVLVVVLLSVACGYKNPVAPAAVEVSDSAPASLSLAATIGVGSHAAETTVRATVRNGHGVAIADSPVTFATASGSCAPNSHATGADGIAQTIVSTATRTLLTVTAGDQTVTLIVAAPIPVVPVPVSPPSEPTPTPAPLPTTPNPAPPVMPTLTLTLTMDVASPTVGQAATFTATVTSALAPAASLLWQWDDEGDATLDAQVTGLGPMIRTVRYPTAGPRVLTVRVVDTATSRLAAAAINVIVR